MRLPTILSCFWLVTIAACSSNALPNQIRKPAAYSVTAALGGENSIVLNKLLFARVTGRINGYPGIFIVDTGTSLTGLNQTFADRVGVTARLDGGPLYTGSATLSNYSGLVAHISIANLEMSSYRVNIYPDQVIRQLESSQLIPFSDGFLGGDILTQFRGIIDFAEMKLMFVDSAGPVVPRGGRGVARLHSIPSKNAIAIEATIDGVDALFVIDTGLNDFGVIDLEGKLSRTLRRVGYAPIQSHTGTKIEIEDKFYAARNFEINGIVSNDVVFTAERLPPAGLLPPEIKTIDGFLGLKFFIQNKLIIDYGRMEVRQATPPITPASGTKDPADSRNHLE